MLGVVSEGEVRGRFSSHDGYSVYRLVGDVISHYEPEIVRSKMTIIDQGSHRSSKPLVPIVPACTVIRRVLCSLNWGGSDGIGPVGAQNARGKKDQKVTLLRVDLTEYSVVTARNSQQITCSNTLIRFHCRRQIHISSKSVDPAYSIYCIINGLFSRGYSITGSSSCTGTSVR